MLIELFDRQNLDSESEDQGLRNIVTVKIFDDIYNDMMRSEQTGKDTTETFIAERLQPESKIGIFAPLAKVKLKTCKSANKSQKMDVNDKVVELKYNCNLFARFAEGEKLPPSAGAFLEHSERGFSQDFIWCNAHHSAIDEIDFTNHGFDFQDELYTPITTKEPIAPKAVIEMVSCKSCKLCNTARCPCRQTDPPQQCSDFCGCSEYCENTDTPMPQNVSEDLEEDVIDEEFCNDGDD